MKAKTFEQVQAIVANLAFMDRKFRLLQKGDGFVLQIEYMEADIETGKPEKQRARKWYVSPFSTETEIVETAFKAARVSMDHVLKEHFTYEGRRVYSPHFNVRARMMLADDKDYDGRDSPTSLEVIPTVDRSVSEVRIAGETVGRVIARADGWKGEVQATQGLSPLLRTKTLAARWVAEHAR